MTNRIHQTEGIISLTNNHGLFRAEVKVLNRALHATNYLPLTHIREQAAGCCGHPEGSGAFDDLTRVEVLIAWIDSGNHIF
jgi:hypothetical protein